MAMKETRDAPRNAGNLSEHPPGRAPGKPWAAMGLLALCLAAALPLFASEPQAAGDAWRALSAGPGIEVRDAFNRAVSRPALEREIKAGSFEILAQAAAFASLPKSRLVLELLERSAWLASTLRRRGPFSGGRETLSAALPMRKPALLPVSGGEERSFHSDSCPKSPFSSSLPAASGRFLPLVLRC